MTPRPPMAVRMAERAPDTEALHAVATLRLHPLSWLFILLRQLRAFALPLVVVLIGGGGGFDETDIAALVGAAGLTVHSIWQYFTYRYGFLEHALVIRSGVFQRTLRLIAFERIQNVTLHQTLLHRITGVAEVRLESAGGIGKPEAEMRVLRLDRAQALEARLRADAQAHAHADLADADPARAAAAPAERWLSLSTLELVKLGLISNRGTLLVLAAVGLFGQAGDAFYDVLVDPVREATRSGAELVSQWHPGPLLYVLAVLLLIVFGLVLTRVLSVTLAILQFHGFRLESGKRELRVERGLLSRVRMHLPRNRIQAFSLSESMLHRWFRRQSLKVDRSTIEAANSKQSMRDLVPLADPARMATILSALLPQGRWPLQGWQPLHPKAWRRAFLIPALAVSLFFTANAALGRPEFAYGLLLVPVLYVRARIWARYSAWTLDGGVIAFRQGWLDRNCRFAEVRKLQSLRLSQSPFDRRYGMATLSLDTIGASPMEPPLRIPYLDAADADALLEALRAQLPRESGAAGL